MKKPLIIFFFVWTAICCVQAQNCITYITNVFQPAGNSILTAVDSLGQAPFTYVWSTGQTTASISVGTPGDYCVTVTNNTGCISTGCTTYWNGYCWVRVEKSVDINGQPIFIADGNTGPGWTYVWNTGSTGISTPNVGPGAYCVTATSSYGCVTDSCGYETTIVPVAETNQSDLFRVFPNPTQDLLMVETPETADLWLTNLQGQVVRQSHENGPQARLLLDKEPVGIYILTVRTARDIRTVKVRKE